MRLPTAPEARPASEVTPVAVSPWLIRVARLRVTGGFLVAVSVARGAYRLRLAQAFNFFVSFCASLSPSAPLDWADAGTLDGSLAEYANQLHDSH